MPSVQTEENWLVLSLCDYLIYVFSTKQKVSSSV